MMAFTMVPRAVLLLGTLCCASAFTLTPSLSTSTGVMTRSVMPLRMQSKGFGQGSANQKKISTVGKDRKAAAQRYESIKKAGSPEFSVFFRKIGAGDEDGVIRGGWYPVGSLTCPSSQEVNKAIFATEDALLQGAFRVHQKQILREFQTRDGGKVAKWQDMKLVDLEYGWQFKEFPDEEVTVAEKPREPSQVENVVGGLFQKLQDGVNWVPKKPN
mmetsp:Transcript_20886/g.49685  ORF Transcript_20886/g.49685 Transcript_20886/m.49685 type:complete len:215 (-) Transcript_20886:32-676(-)